MKVYVSELPKSCDKCEYVYQEYSCDWHRCKFNGEYIEKDCILKDCPLLTLTEHTKQVRKEVCEMLEKRIIKYLDSKNNCRASLDVHSIIQQFMKEDLYQIQGENDDTRRNC